VAERIGMAPTGVRLLQLLADRDRLGMAGELLAVFRERLLDRRKIVRADVRSAVALAPEALKAIESRLGAVTGKNVAIDAAVDPALIGGVVAKVGGTVYDGTVKSQLEKLRKQLVGAGS
jgi:F-type H+-transporting ATPase subunit delta